jgi:hypothetical protein
VPSPDERVPDDLEFDVWVPSRNEVALRDVRFAPTVISGRVLDPDRQPLAGVTVQTMTFHGAVFSVGPGAKLPAVWPRTVTTGEDGRFTLAEVNAASLLRIVATHAPSGLSKAVYIGTECSNDPPGPGSRNIPRPTDIRLLPRRQVSGRVLDRDRPVAGVPVTVRYGAACDQGLQMTTRTGANGQFTLEAPNAANWWTAYVEPEPATALLPSRPVTLEPPRTPQSAVQDIKLSRGTRLTGRVVEEGTNNPVRGARVQYLADVAKGNELIGYPAPTTVTDDAGQFDMVVPKPLSKCQPGIAIVARDPKYVLTKRVPNYEARDSDYVHAAAPIPENPSTDFTIQLTHATTIRGRVNMPNGSPLADGLAWCSLNPDGTGYLRQVRVQDGLFEIAGCERGQAYVINVTDRTGCYGVEVKVLCNGSLVELTLDPIAR